MLVVTRSNIVPYTSVNKVAERTFSFRENAFVIIGRGACHTKVPSDFLFYPARQEAMIMAAHHEKMDRVSTPLLS